MTWTSDPPTAEGFYWIRRLYDRPAAASERLRAFFADFGARPCAVTTRDEDGELVVVLPGVAADESLPVAAGMYANFEWSTPLVPPQ